MRGFALCLMSVGFIFNIVGCQLFSGNKTNSEWSVLQQARNAECGPWPLGPKDLQINDVKMVHDDKPAFVATGTKRDGSPSYYYLPFGGDTELDRDELVPLKLGRDSVFLGASRMGKVPVAGVVRNQEAKAVFELRTVKDNVVKYSADLTELPVTDGTMLSVDDGAWLNYRRDDHGLRFSFIDWAKADKITAKNLRTIEFGGQPIALPKADHSGILAIWRDDKGDRRFKIRQLARDGQATEPTVLEVKIDGEVESWSAVAHQQGFYLAYIEGDSLVGQATMRVAYFNWRDGSPAVQWQKEQLIKDIHVGEPVFAHVKDGLEVLLLNWVDDESTIARYQVSTGTLGQPSFSGVFTRGARVLDAFSEKDGTDVFTLMRYREDNKWTFKVCKI